MGKLFGIQYLRAVAALAVVCFHAAIKEGSDFHIGEAGVDIFFVISGFLMVAITTDQTAPLRFAQDRIKRIVPVYWFATTVMLLGVVAGLFPNARLESWHVFASYAFLPAQSPTADYIWPLLVPGWILNYEMSFYALFAVTLLLRGEALRLMVLSAVLIGAALIGLVAAPESVAGRFYTDQIILEFAAGCWLGFLWKNHRESFRYGAGLIAVGVVGFASSWLMNATDDRALFYGLPAVLVVAGVLALEKQQPIAGLSFPVLLGDASYSIYIWHTLAISVTSKVGSLLGLPAFVTISLNIIGGTIIGLIAYFVVERPLRRLFARRKVTTDLNRESAV